MKIAEKKKPKEIEKEIRTKIIEAMDSILSINPTSSEKLKKMIRKAASVISKKYIKAVKKDEKKTGEIKPAASRKTVTKKKPVKRAAAKKTTKPTPVNERSRVEDPS